MSSPASTTAGARGRGAGARLCYGWVHSLRWSWPGRSLCSPASTQWAADPLRPRWTAREPLVRQSPCRIGGERGPEASPGLSALLRSTRSFWGSRPSSTGKAWPDYWTGDPWTRGSYAADNPRQVTKYWGYVGIPEGKVHFAGEHMGAGDRWQRSTGVQDPGEQAGGSSVRRFILCRRRKVACEGISARFMSGCPRFFPSQSCPFMVLTCSWGSVARLGPRKRPGGGTAWPATLSHPVMGREMLCTNARAGGASGAPASR